MAFQQGLSGLNAASRALDVISNNVANSSTVGFKGSTALFSDVFASAMNGASAGAGGQVGIGTSAAAIAQQFQQGGITATNNPLDLAINGAGFFRMSGEGAITYSRNGQFDVDKDGYIVNTGGFRLTGYPANTSGTILPATPVDLQVDTSDLQPNASSAIDIGMNLDSRNTTPVNAFDETDPSTYNASTSVTVYDSLGNDHILTMYFRKASGGTWDVYHQLDGGTATAFGSQLTFDGAGALTGGASQTISLTIPASFGANTPQSVAIDFTGSTQYGSGFGVNRTAQDGYASGSLSGMAISEEGILQGRYSNGQTRNLGQVVLANFSNPGGLISVGDNLWAESPDSGQPLVGAPGTGSLGLLSSGAVEDSNVDLTAQLVNMITQQRAYQANAQSIRTQDEILQTLVNL
ncbi:flagellar hook protein FlgE [Nitrogeniibacter mangrovi]|uniref:Flagellar hook protein FlgE n=1 Tax=Nitrogeniibacter mangrovi TaxID=2016596 RepID=A0A6C1B7T8_9RHOO|nr:flagellar hook protein FlgE [Nitrogeniibacter mangrovi]QID18380.1 flagellar hook protein FlgE [Nitrogeniibacter mangrovi]